MSEVTTSGEASVAPVETPSAPLAPAPVFGASRGSGLARGKRPSAPAPATSKDAAPSSYQPTAIQVVNHQREYINPFAPVPAPAPVVETPVVAEQPVASVVVSAEQSAPVVSTPVVEVVPVAVTPAPVAPVENFTPAPKAVVEPKAELKILPPEEMARPAQSWEIGGQSDKPTASANPRREGRPDFRPQRHDERQAARRDDARPAARSDDRPARSEQPQDPRNEFRPREPRREPSGDRRESFGERKEQSSEQPRREQRTFEPKPTPAVAEAKKSGFLGWLKGLFSGDAPEKTPAAPTARQDERSGGEGRRYEGGNRGGNRGGQYNRGGGGGGRGRGGYRGDNRGGNRGPQFGAGPEGQGQNQNQSGPNPEQHGHGGEQRRFDDGNRGGGRRHHRGGRGRFRGDNREGGNRSEGGPSGGPSSGPTS